MKRSVGEIVLYKQPAPSPLGTHPVSSYFSFIVPSCILHTQMQEEQYRLSCMTYNVVLGSWLFPFCSLTTEQMLEILPRSSFRPY